MTGLAGLIGYGLVLGWSVAWPPGPINAEMIRRGLAAGPGPAFAVGIGACMGDALWAAAVMLGVGLVIGARLQFALTLVSTVLLLCLAGLFLRGAWRGWQAREAPSWPLSAPESRGFAARRGFLLGLGMAASSPWNFAFWLAVIGRPESLAHGMAGALVIAAAVLAGAASWCVVLCAILLRLRLRFGGPLWQVAAQGATGFLMFGFALQQLRGFVGA